MLEEISLENIGVITHARIPLAPGLTAITGETGAGKTMLLTGLDLLMGGKADPGRVRTGTERAAAEGTFVLAPGAPARERVADAGGELDDDGTLVVLRTVAAAGRSRAHLGGRTVPQTVLAEIAGELVTVHGQADQLRLRSPRRQREALDAYLGRDHLALLERYRDAWAERTAVGEEAARLVAERDDRAREAELLRLGLTEIERVEPRAGEDTELDMLVERLSNVEEIRAGAADAHATLVGDDSGDDRPHVISLVDHARRALEHAGEHDPALADLAERIAEAGYALAEVGTELSSHLAGLEADPAALERAHERRAQLTGLTRSYGQDAAAVLEWASHAGLRLLELEGGDERLVALRERRDALDALLADMSADLGEARRRGANVFADDVTAELDGLAMAGASLLVDVADTELGPYGANEVTISLVPHAGAPASPLGRGASGGELSRVMLAVEVVLAASRSGETPSFVFDEIDAGIGGRAALEVGARLARLARDAQVIVVTHLAQVAAYADQHVVVTKSTAADGDVVTQSDVRTVVGDERLAELARMLSGQDSDTARAHAAELLRSTVVG
ncbi:DNA repair protein RecN [Sanguibacter sp. A247]|uniref:DNA repair protein RecN n=1 Tax=Sanguibacter sp. A247 TaxID=3457327 RepID=UPI003FD77807